MPNISDKPTAHWSGYVLVAIYIGSQVASTFFMGAQMDKTQRKIFLLLPLVLITVVSRFPIGLAHVLDDDQPLDGRARASSRGGSCRDAGAALAQLRPPARNARRANAARRHEAATGNGAAAGRPGAASPPPAAAAAGQAQEGRPAPVSDDGRSRSRRPARRSARRSGRRCASSSGSRPALDKASVEFQVV